MPQSLDRRGAPLRLRQPFKVAAGGQCEVDVRELAEQAAGAVADDRLARFPLGG